MKVKFSYVIFFFITGITHGEVVRDVSNSTYAVVKTCKSLKQDKCKDALLITRKINGKKKYILNDLNRIKSDELYFNFKKNGKGTIYYTYTNQFGVDQEWRDFDYLYKNDILSLRLDKNAYIIDSLLKKDESQPFLDRSPFSTINKNAKIVDSGSKEQPLIYDQNTGFFLNMLGDRLILKCKNYLMLNKGNPPITNLCENSENILFLEKIK